MKRFVSNLAPALIALSLLSAHGCTASTAAAPDTIPGEPPSNGVGGQPCSMPAAMKASEALQTCRNWITYQPAAFGSVTKAQLQADLQFLYDQGFRGLVTYDVAGELANAPKVAKAIGFEKVVAGIYDLSKDVVAQAQLVAADADAVVIGNEGIHEGRYSFQQMQAAVDAVRGNAGLNHLETTTSEPWILYLNQGNSWQYPMLMDTGDFVFPNFHPYFDPDPQWHSDPTNAAKLLHDNWVQWFKGKSHPVILKESWWPSALGDPANPSASAEVCFASPANQATYFSALASFGDLFFIWGEAQDLSKKPELIGWCGDAHKDASRHWGMWKTLAAGQTKPAVGSIDMGSY